MADEPFETLLGGVLAALIRMEELRGFPLSPFRRPEHIEHKRLCMVDASLPCKDLPSVYINGSGKVDDSTMKPQMREVSGPYRIGLNRTQPFHAIGNFLGYSVLGIFAGIPVFGPDSGL